VNNNNGVKTKGNPSTPVHSVHFKTAVFSLFTPSGQRYSKKIAGHIGGGSVYPVILPETQNSDI
jgi:hypothetical protein